MKKILLTAVNAKYIHSNLAVYSLQAYAAERGISAELMEATINQGRDEILKGLYRKQPDVLCFSCYIWNISYVRELAADFHKIQPETEIWFGGPEVSFDAEKVLTENPALKGVMRGEGEATFTELASYYCGKSGALVDIRGITFRTEDGDIQTNPERDVLDLSSIPFPFKGLSEFEHRIIYYESSRGCPFSCSYCLSSVDKRLRFRNLTLVKQELRFFLEQKVLQVKFVDRTFNCDKKHSREIWRYLVEQDNGITNFHFEIAADLLEEEDLQLFGRMRPGLIQLEIGVQSTNLKTLSAIRRKMDFEKVKTMVRRVQEGGNIHQHLDLIAGLPFEDLQSFAKSFADVYALHPQQLQLGFLKVLKGSFMGEHIGDYKGLFQEKEPYEILSTRWLPYGDVLQLKAVEDMVEVYYNSGQFQSVLSFIERLYPNMFQFYRDLGNYYEVQGYFGISHTRIRRYEILLAFLEEKFLNHKLLFEELCTIDVYARENAKSRPGFAADLGSYKEQIRAFYQAEEQKRTILFNYQGYDWKQMLKMTHIEVLCGGIYQKPSVLLFDYRERNPRDGSARCVDITNEMSWFARKE